MFERVIKGTCIAGLLQDFEDSLAEGGNRHSPRTESWSDKIKSFFDELVP